MDYSVLDTVVLNRDLPEHGLKRGDVGAIVDIYDGKALEVEFVTASGRTGALLTLSTADISHILDTDLVTILEYL